MRGAFQLSLGALLLLFLSLGHTETPVDLDEQVQLIVKQERALAGTPALAVAVVADHKIAALFADGFADLESQVKATPQTPFQVASLTKPVTAMLVMREVEAGRLELDAPVNDLLPPERQIRDPDGKPVPATLRQLLSHSAGIAFGSAMQPDPDVPLRTMDEHLSRGVIAIRKPGERVIYASNGFALAGWLAARASGEPFDVLAKRAIFEPLNMNRSSLATPREYGADLAAVYEDARRIPHASNSAGMPSGALIASAEDLARFALLCLGRGETDGVRILSAASMDEMMTLQARMHPRVPEGFGLGFGVRELPDRRFVWWDGQLPGVASRLALLPERGVGIVVLANRAENEVVIRTANRILNLLVPEAPLPLASNSATDAAQLVGNYQLAGMFAPPRSIVERFANLTIENIDGALTISTVLSSKPSRVIPLGNGLFATQSVSLDRGYGIVDGDRLFMSVIEGRRVPMWQTATAWFIYAGILGITILVTLGWGVWAAARRLRRR